jgi:tetratricopeptide (TPR) repeat protein
VALAQSNLKLKRLAAAENVFGDLDRLAPKMAWGPYGMGAIAAMRGDLKRAVALLDEALGRDPRHAPSLRVRADLAAQAGDVELEERMLGRYLTEVPSAAWAHARLGDLAIRADHLEDARRSFLQAYALQPDATTARRLAELAQRRDDHAEARLWQERAGTLPADAKAKQPDPEGP